MSIGFILTEVMVLTDADLRASVDDTTILLLQEVGPNSLDTLVGTATEQLELKRLYTGKTQAY